MAVMEKIGEAMQQTEEKKKGLRNSILKLLLEWTSFEKDFDMSTTCLKECFNELDAKEKNLNAVQESVVESTKELDSIRESVEKRRKEVEAKEEEFRVFCDKESRELECKWEEFKLARKGFDDIVKLREEKLNEQESMVERLWSETEYERRQLEDLGKSVDSKFMEISVKEKEFEERSKGLNRIESRIREETNALLLKEKEFKECVEEFEIKEKALQLMEREISDETDALLLKESKFKEQVEEFKIKEKALQLMEKEMETRERSLDSVRDELMAKENCLDNVKEELKVKDAELDSVKKELGEKEHNLASIQKELREKETTLVMVKTELCGKVNNLGSVKKEFRIKEDRLSLLKKEMETRERSLDSVREELMAKENCLDNVKEELRVKEAELDTVKKELGEKEYNMESIRKELREKETTLVSVTTELQGKVNDLDSVKKQLRIKEDHLSLLKKDLEIKDKSADTINKKLERREQDLIAFQERLQFWEGELNFVESEYRRRLKELDSREKKLDPVSLGRQRNDGELKLEKENLQNEQGLLKKRMEDIALKEKQVEARFGELKQREKHIEDRLEVLEEQEKQLKTVCNVPVETEPTDNVQVDRVGAITTVPADIRFCINDGKSLQMFLNEREKARDSMSDEVFKALQLSPDPGQLVLEAMEGFYPPHLRKGDTEFEGNVTRQSCILLLEQLIRVSPIIQPTVLVSAYDLAREWKDKLRATAENQLDILGFLYLLAAYNMAPAFKEDELVRLLIIVVEQNKTKDLCCLLGVMEKISCFIQNLIANQKHVEAVKYAYAFDLVGHFPPIPILKDYVKQVMQISENACNRETCSAEEKNEAIEQSIASIRAVIRCISDHELQDQYPSTQLKECIESLTRQKADATASSVISEAQKPQQTQLVEMTSACPSLPTDTKALCSTSSSGKASTCKLGHSDAFATILVGMGGKNLQTLLNDHCSELELLRIEVSRALKISTDSGMLVLEALGGFYPPESYKEEIEFNHSIIRKSCIILLEQLMRISSEITPNAKLEASKLASDWKAKMIAKMENDAILGFLLLVGAYGLASSFDKNELYYYCCTVAQHRSVTQISHALGISVMKRPMSHSNDETRSNNDEKRRKQTNSISGCILSIVHRTSDPAKIVLDALRKCYFAQRQRSRNVLTKKRKRETFIVAPSVMKRFCDLLEQLREVSAEIRPQVKTEATDFAVEWRATLTGSLEALGFLNFVASFELSSSFDSDDLLALVQHNKRAMNLIKILGLADKSACVIENLIRSREWLLACTYTYEFGLVDLFSPVVLLRNYVLQETEIANQIRNGRCSREVQEKAINCELSALKAAVDCIVLHNLQSEYSPDKLMARISELERQMASLNIPNQHPDVAAKSQCDGRNRGTLCEPISQVQKAVSENHLASANEGVCISKRQKRKLKRKLKRKRLDQLRLQTKVGPNANCGTTLSSVQSSFQPTSRDAQISPVKPIQSNEDISEPIEACPADGQVSDAVPVHSGLASSQLLGDSNACADSRLEPGQAVIPAQASCQHTDLKISNAASVHTVQASSQLLDGSTHAHHQMALPVCSVQTSHQTGQAVLPAQASYQPTDVKISNPAPVHTIQASSQLLGGSTHAHHQITPPVCSNEISDRPAGDLRLQENALSEVPGSPYNFQEPSSTVSQMSNFREQYVSHAAVDGAKARGGAPLERPYESLCAPHPHPHPHPGVISGGCTSVIPNSNYYTQLYVSDPRVGMSNFRAPTLQLHPNHLMQHNRLDAPPGVMFRNYPGPNNHFIAASGVPPPFLPRVHPFYHQQTPHSPNVVRPNYFY